MKMKKRFTSKSRKWFIYINSFFYRRKFFNSKRLVLVPFILSKVIKLF